MNWKNIFLLVILFLVFSSCYEEDKIIPTNEEDVMLRFEFPQGNNSWDNDIVEISKEFGVYLIYKGFDTTDFNRTWTGGGLVGTEWIAGDLQSDEQAEFCVDFMKNHVFYYLNAEILDRVLPQYIYLVYDFHNDVNLVLIPGVLEMYMKNFQTFNMDGLDFWMTCLFYGEPDPSTGEKPETPETPEDFRIRRGEILGGILRKAFEKGNIKLPAGLGDGIDYKTSLLTSDADKDEENYYLFRGFPGNVDPSFNSSGVGDVKPMQINEYFIQLMFFSMRYTKVELNEMWDPNKYPLVHQKQQLVVDWMKSEYGIDLEAIAELK